jgi:hypothetical protein
LLTPVRRYGISAQVVEQESEVEELRIPHHGCLQTGGYFR